MIPVKSVCKVENVEFSLARLLCCCCRWIEIVERYALLYSILLVCIAQLFIDDSRTIRSALGDFDIELD